MESFASEGTPGGFIYLLRGSFLYKYLFTHTRNGFLTQLKNNSFVMTLGRNAGKAMKYLLKFQRKQAGKAAWWLIRIPSAVQQGHRLSRLREGCWLSPAALAHTSTFAAKLPCSTVSANSTPGHCWQSSFLTCQPFHQVAGSPSRGRKCVSFTELNIWILHNQQKAGIKKLHLLNGTCTEQKISPLGCVRACRVKTDISQIEYGHLLKRLKTILSFKVRRDLAIL